MYRRGEDWGHSLTRHLLIGDRLDVVAVGQDANGKGSRMIPNAFEAYTLAGAVDDASHTTDCITMVKLRDTESFV